MSDFKQEYLGTWAAHDTQACSAAHEYYAKADEHWRRSKVNGFPSISYSKLMANTAQKHGVPIEEIKKHLDCYERTNINKTIQG